LRAARKTDRSAPRDHGGGFGFSGMIDAAVSLYKQVDSKSIR
jgi:hypothetical protein